MAPSALRLAPLAAIVASLASACSGAPAGSSPADDGDARVATVQSALVEPTGTVSPASVRALAGDWRSFQQVVGAFDAVLSVGEANMQACLMGASPSTAVLAAEGDGGAAATAGAYDLSCVTGGKVLGRLSFQLEPPPSDALASDAGAEQRLAIQLEGACAGDACVTADVFAWIAPRAALGCTSLVTLAATATVTIAGASQTFSFGAQGGAGRGDLTGDMVYFDDDGRSFTVQSAGDGSPAGTLLVTGAGQSFECTQAAAGGRCQGATSFVY
jgi:hypothetical protein